jgi:hypothetical protein
MFASTAHLRLGIAAFAAVAALAITGVASAIVRPGGPTPTPPPPTAVAVTVQGGTTGDGPASVRECAGLAAEIGSYLNAAEGTSDAKQAATWTNMANQLDNIGTDEGCFFVYT